MRGSSRSKRDSISAASTTLGAAVAEGATRDFRNASTWERSRAESAEELAGELAERTHGDLERGFTGHGPHRDELALVRGGRDLRAFGSQGQQRLVLLALLFAERAALLDAGRAAPLMLLDDVMSELDAAHRELLVSLLEGSGQSVISATETAHVPSASALRIAVRDGGLSSAPALRAA